MLINIKVKPNSGLSEIEKIDDDNYVVKLKSVPENNKANLELLKVLKKYFGCEVKIKRGFSSRRKIVEVFF